MEIGEHFERDYTVDWSKVDDNDPEGDLAMDIIGSVVHDLRKFDEDAVKVIDPTVKRHFDRMLSWSVKMAKEYNGRVYGDIIIDRLRAEIRLEVPCYDFFDDEEHSYMRCAMKYASSIALEPTPDGLIRLRMYFNYFQALHTAEEQAAFRQQAAQNLQKKIEGIS